MLKNSFFRTGLVSLALAIFLFFIGIPYGITSPSNVSNIVLSPLFWPEVLSGVLALTGIALMLTAKSAGKIEIPASQPSKGGYKRLTVMVALLIVYVAAIPKIGMVWASIAAFIAFAWLIRTPHRIGSVIAAVAVSLILYAFFAHVAGVAVPQGDFVILP